VVVSGNSLFYNIAYGLGSGGKVRSEIESVAVVQLHGVFGKVLLGKTVITVLPYATAGRI